MKLIDDVGSVWHRLWTVRLAIISAIYSAAAGAWVLMPPEWQPQLHEWVRWILVTVGVMIAASPGVARVIQQPKLREPDDTDKAGA